MPGDPDEIKNSKFFSAFSLFKGNLYYCVCIFMLFLQHIHI